MSTWAERPLIGTLEISGLRCPGRHGAYAGEQDQVRVFLVDLGVRTDVAAAARSDRLEEALDVAALAQMAREVVAGPPHSLLEHLALDLARTLLQRFPSIEQARVHVSKPDPPGLDADREAVELTLSRS